MLGGEQSGHIEAVGFEMYTTMLEEAVRKIKGEEDKPAHAGTAINLGISVRIDSSYIPEENQRLRMYKRIAGAEDQATLADVRAELQDRYGTPPESVLNLLAAGELRLLSERLGIAQLDRKRTQIELPARGGAASSGPQHTMLKRHQPAKPTTAKVFVEMLHIRFAAAAADTSQQPAAQPDGVSPARAGVDPAMMMKLVSRNAKRGAQFSPQGVLRWPLSSAKAEDVLAETRALLETLDRRQPATA
jgi:transcription-repair coupling factor (superfamily II helicase)